MDLKRLKSCVEWLFVLGMAMAVFVLLERRFVWLPDFASGLLGGVAVTLLLGARALRYAFQTEK